MRKVVKGILIAVGAAGVTYGALLIASIAIVTKEIIDAENYHNDYLLYG